ncbi:uncharacterized protein PRCAT00005597001 [Priceomyces carsonii]|uniref:uncharacterized protein n=1 Tax=Priceomyces carsonii TaxID=28549 RepID=UPI002ED7E136|nr:unnamed protein product [Priceomyces carsonii]
MRLRDDELLKDMERISELIQKYLGFPDSDYTLSKYVQNLYKESLSNYDVDPLQLFEDSVKKNGGSDFPSVFIQKCFLILHSNVKSEDNLEQIKKEEIDDFQILSLPDRRQGSNSDNRLKEENDEVSKSKKETSDILVDGIYRGYVSNLKPYGAFIRLNDPKSFVSGLCHVSQISFDGHQRINSPADVLKINQEVFVKIRSIDKKALTGSRKNTKEKISLTMRGIDQITGLDRTLELKDNNENSKRGRELSISRGTKRRFTSPERWEIRQLISSGAAKAEDYPEIYFDEDPNSAFRPENKSNGPEEIDIDIEVSQREPLFLKGTSKSLTDLAPVKVMKNPEGSLGRSAMNGSKLAKDFKENSIKERQKRERDEKSRESNRISTHDPLSQELVSEQSRNKVISEWKKSRANENISYGKKTNLSIEEQRKSLPIYLMRQDLIDKIRENQFLVVVGETGSGKTTQIVQYLDEEGLNVGKDGRVKLIGCTQPRRVAATSVAKRVSEEVGCKLGEEVGYTIRFEDRTGPHTRIKYMTDGMLEREALNDPLMNKYSIIMLDEAHERTISTDILFSLLKKAAVKNPDLRIIVTSATLDAEKFSKYFNSCPIVKIPGRTFPVEILYTREPEMDYLSAALDSVMQIHLSEPAGDILVFLTGQEEIDTSCEILYQRIKALGNNAPELIILPVYSALPSEMQSRIFEPTPAGSRKVVLATNIGETSITIDGIYYVVDPGFVKLNAYDSRLGMDTLTVSAISQAQANQRSGRAGRTGPGRCYRLYTENAFKTEMLPNSVPEIQRQNLSHTILMLKAMGINDLIRFDFMDPPPTSTMLTALQDLYTLSALDDSGFLTSLGRKMADFPMEPALSKMLITSVEFGCSEEILTIVAMLSVQSVFYRPKDKQDLADRRKARFHHSQGDHLTLLNVYRAWTLNGFSKEWCLDNFIHERAMRRAQEVRRQITTIMQKYKHMLVSCGADTDRVRKTICSAYFKHAAKRDPQEGFKTIVEQLPVSLHPSSSLFGKNPEFVVYHSLILTTKEYMHCATTIEPRWLADFAPSFFKIADPATVSLRNKNKKIVPLYDNFSKDKDSWRLSSHNAAKKRALGNG